MTDANTDCARMVAVCTSGDEPTVRELLRETPPLARQVYAQRPYRRRLLGKVHGLMPLMFPRLPMPRVSCPS